MLICSWKTAYQKEGVSKLTPPLLRATSPEKIQIFREGATNIIDISILALPLIAKQLGGVRRSREGVRTQTHFKTIIKQKKKVRQIFEF